jgi:hypothetical protein
MNINDLVEGLGEALTMDNFHAPQVEIVEVSIPIIPTWLKWFCRIGALALVVFIIRDFIKTSENKKRLREIELLKLLNDEITASKIVAENKLDYYGL